MDLVILIDGFDTDFLHFHCLYPENTSNWTNAVLKLVQRLRRWFNFKTALVQYISEYAAWPRGGGGGDRGPVVTTDDVEFDKAWWPSVRSGLTDQLAPS